MIGGVRTPWKLARHGQKDTGRINSPAHRAWIRRQLCLCMHLSVSPCGGPVQCAHWRGSLDAGLSQKPSDEWTLPLCFEHHRVQHSMGEPAFAKAYGLKLEAICRSFAKRSPVREIRERANV